MLRVNRGLALSFLLAQCPVASAFSRNLRPSKTSTRLLSAIGKENDAVLRELLDKKQRAVDSEDYLLAAKLKDQIEAIKHDQSSVGVKLYVDRKVSLHEGDRRFPPMVEVPCECEGVLELQKIVKPPDADLLWQWYSEIGNMDADASWAELWPSASSLAGALVKDRSKLEGLDVVELGAGLGVAGVVAACLGAKSVTLLDREPYALHCAMSTAVLADQGQTVHAAVVDWSDPSFLDKYSESADCLIASDVLYDPDTVVSLAKLIGEMHRRPGVAWITDPKTERVPGLRALFSDTLRDNGAQVTVTELPPAPVYASCYSETSNAENTVLIEATWL